MSQHDEANQDPNLAFTLKAVNEEAKRIWADSKNRSRYVPAEPALQFFFNHSPKNFDKRFVLGSNYKSCDALLSDPGDSIPEEMLAFTFNKQHQLIMNVVSDHQASVTFKQQKQGNRKRFSWIFPHGDHQIRVKVANGIEFDVVLPEYGRNKTEFYNNCKQFLGSSTNDDLLSYSIEVDTGAIASYDNETSKRQKPFYLRGRKIGSGSYGDVFQALQMPGGNIVAAKRFHSTRDFRNEVAMLRKVCEETQHVSTYQHLDDGAIVDRSVRITLCNSLRSGTRTTSPS